MVGLGAASFFTDLAAEMITPLLPLFLKKEFRTGAATLGAIEGICDSAASLLRLVSGWLSDRLRKRKFLVFIGYSFSVVARPLMSVVAAAWQVGGLRLLDRIGKGIRLAPRDALIADSCEPQVRGKAFGLQNMLDNLGGMTGMLVAAALVTAFAGDYRKIFLITVVPALCVLVVVLFVVRDVPIRTPPARLVVTLRPFDPSFKWFLLCVTIFTLGNSSDLFILLRLSGLGVEDKWVVIAWAGHTAIRMLMSIPAGMIADRFGKKRVVFTGWVIYGIVYLGLGWAVSLQATLVLLALYALYYAFASSVMRAVVADLVREDLRGTAYGMLHFCVGLAVLPANLVFGFVWKMWGPKQAFLISAGCALTASLMLLALRRSRSPRHAEPRPSP